MNVFQDAERLLVDFRPEHSEFQIEHFIVGGGNLKHVYERYIQALREIDARHAAMLALHGRLEDAKQRRTSGWLSRLRRLLKVEPSLSEIRALQLSYDSKRREYDKFVEIAGRLKEQVGELTAERRRGLEIDSWVHKAKVTAALDFLSMGGLQRSTVDFIASFPTEFRGSMIEWLKPESRQKLLSILD